MIKSIIKLQILFLITAFLFFIKSDEAHASSEILTTDHFTISYNSSNSICAAALAVSLESYHDQAASFLETEPGERMTVYLSPETMINVNPLKNSSELYISPYGNFSASNRSSYNDIFISYLGKTMHDGKGLSLLDENFINALKDYSEADQNLKKIIIEDLVNNCGITTIALNGIKEYNRDMQQGVYTALTDFIISSYGKKILIQTLKDADYYRGFYESLSSITGDSIDAISGKFNLYLLQHKSGTVSNADVMKPAVQENNGYNDISYSISGNGQIAVLQKNLNSSRLLLKSEKNGKEIILDHSGQGTSFNNIVFAGNDKIAITEIGKSGSTIHIYDAASGRFTGRMFLHYLFISKIDHLKEMTFVFSAGCGLTSDIYTLDLNTGKFGILTGSGNNFYPLVMNGKFYFISVTEKSRVIELDLKSGERKEIYSDKRKFSNLNRADNNRLIFSFENNNPENNYTFNPQTGDLQQISKGISLCISPLISGQSVYYISFFQSRYRLFYTLYNPSDN